jgi:hypothetical protein
VHFRSVFGSEHEIDRQCHHSAECNDARHWHRRAIVEKADKSPAQSTEGELNESQHCGRASRHFTVRRKSQRSRIRERKSIAAHEHKQWNENARETSRPGLSGKYKYGARDSRHNQDNAEDVMRVNTAHQESV